MLIQVKDGYVNARSLNCKDALRSMMVLARIALQ
jgi:hypothetical protein